MAIKTFYFENVALFAKLWQLAESAPSSADTITSVKNGTTAAGRYFGFVPGITDNVVNAATFIDDDADGAHGWRSESKYSGSFAAGNWTITYKVVNRAKYAHSGQIYARIYRTAVDDPVLGDLAKMNSVDGASAIISFTATADQVRTGTFVVNCDQNLALVDEYIFIVLNWKVTTAGGNVQAGVKIEVNAGAAEKVDATDYTPAAVQYVYNGNVPLVALPSHASVLDRIYGGAASLSVVPTCQSAFDRVYAGSAGIALVPNSIYLLEEATGEFVYLGDVPMVAMPSYSSALEKGYQGDVAMMFSPSYVAAMEKGYQGGVDMALSPSYLSALERVYQGQVDLDLLPNHSLVVDRIYGGDAGPSLLPAYMAALEKAYEGSVEIVMTPTAIYFLQGTKGGEFVYLGDVPLALVPSYALAMDRAYDGQVPMALMPAHALALDRAYLGIAPLTILPGYERGLEKTYEGSVALVLTPGGLYWLTSLQERIYEGNVVLTLLPSCVVEAHGPLVWVWAWEYWR